MPYIYRNLKRTKEDPDEIPFETFLLHQKPVVETPEQVQARIDAQAEVMKGQFIALAQRMHKTKPD